MFKTKWSRDIILWNFGLNLCANVKTMSPITICWHKFIFSFIPEIAVMTVYIQFGITYIARIYHSFKPNIFHAIQVCMILCTHLKRRTMSVFTHGLFCRRRVEYYVLYRMWVLSREVSSLIRKWRRNKMSLEMMQNV